MAFQKTRDIFSNGRGLPYPAHPYKSPDKNDAQRNTPVPIDIDGLEQPGSGPVNFTPQKGLNVPGLRKSYRTQDGSDNE